MDLTPYLLLAFDVYPKVSVIISGVTVEAIFKTSSHKDTKTWGGLTDTLTDTSIMVKTSDLTNPKELKGNVINLNGTSYRVASVTYGEGVCTLFLVDPSTL
jgi:hypothetical protein